MKNVYIVGICGSAMASLAGILKSEGYNVIGSDSSAYPPMSEVLESQGIRILKGYKKENLIGIIDNIEFAIIGNVVHKDNEEAVLLMERKVPYYSMPAFMERFILPRYRVLVVSGTHGKSSTTSMLASILDAMDEDPSFLVGAIPLNFNRSFRLSKGKYFVIEGDEYDTAFFDKSPKFLHYLPYAVIVTSIEFDHADIYSDFDVYREQFKGLLKIVNPEGFAVLKDDDVARDTLKNINVRQVFYGDKTTSYAYIKDIEYSGEFMQITSNLKGEDIRYRMQVFGRQNALNSLSVITLLNLLGYETKRILDALWFYRGVRRRMEYYGDFNGIGIIDDFAHHPTAVKTTLDAARKAYIETGRYRRLIAIFEPRSNTSRRNIFFEQYSAAFSDSDLVIMSRPYRKADNIKNELDVNGVLQNIKRCGINGISANGVDDLLRIISGEAKEGDLLLFMSNGDFGGLVNKTIKLLKGGE